MANHKLTMAYSPKIPAIDAGTCTQTIREGRKVKPGDTIEFIHYSGIPHQTAPDWNKTIKVSSVLPILIYSHGIRHKINYDWNHAFIHNLARKDGMNPGTGQELKKILNSYCRLTKIPREYQIIRWNDPPQVHDYK